MSTTVGVMTPSQAGMLFAAFQRWAADGGRGEASDRSMACLVLYADGSGGLALDTPPGERPPTTWTVADNDLTVFQQAERAVLDVRWDRAETALEAFPLVSTPAAEITVDQAEVLRTAVLFLAARDRVAELEQRRNLCRCTSARSSSHVEAFDAELGAHVVAGGAPVAPCWQRQEGGEAAIALCDACERRQELTKRMREASAACGPAGRELRRQLRALGLLVEVDVDGPRPARAPRRRTRRT